MKYDEAIATFQSLVEYISNAYRVGEVKPKDGDWNIQDACVLALSALRDAAERAKGCEYCNPDNIDYYYAGNVPNYCKHCGRDLTKEAQG